MAENVAEFYSWTSLLSLGVAAGAVVVFAGGVRKLTGWSHPVIPFGIAFVIVLGGAHYSRSLRLDLTLDAFFGFVLLLLNTLLLFCTAIGGQEVTAEGVKGRAAKGAKTQAKPQKTWFGSWIRH